MTEIVVASAVACSGVLQVMVSLPVVGVLLAMEMFVQSTVPTFTPVVML
jgi:hypothetical protein